MNKSFLKETIAASLLLLISLSIVFYPIIFEDKTLLVASNKYGGMISDGSYGYPGDDIANLNLIDRAAASWQFQPLFRLVEQMYSRKTLPLWNPYSGTGTPLAADMQSSAFFPPLIIWSYFSGWNANLDHYFIFRLFIAGLFTYLLCRKLKLGFWSSIIGGHIFMLNGYFIGYINQAHMNVEMLLPVLLLVIESYIQTNRKAYFFATSCVTFLVIVGGMPESAFLVLLFASGYALVRIFENDPNMSMLEKLRWLVKIIGGLCMGIGFASFLILPFLEFLNLSAHYHTLQDLSGTWWIDYRTLGTYFLPRILPATQDLVHANIFSGEFAAGAFSIIGFLLFFLIFSTSKVKVLLKVYLILWIVLVAGKIFNIPGFTWIGKLPIFNQIVLVKFPIVELNFAIAMIGAYCWDSINTNKKRAVYSLILGTFIGIFLMLGFSKFYSDFFSKISSKQGELIAYIKNESITNLVSFLAASFVIYLGIHFKRLKKVFTLLSLTFISIIVFVVIRNTKEGWQKNYDPSTKPPFLHKVSSESRILGIDTLHPNVTAPLHFMNLRSNNALYPKNYVRFMESTVLLDPPFNLLTSYNTYDLNSPMIDFLNVKYLSKSSDDTKLPDKYMLIYKDDKYQLFENKQAISRVNIFYNYIFESDTDKALKLVKNKDFDPRTVVISGNQYFPDQPSKNSHGLYNISPTRITPLYLSFKVRTDQPGIFVLSDTNYPGWEAKIDQIPQKIITVNTFLRGLYVSKGNHVVEFVYRPKSWIIGGLLSIGFFILFIIYLQSGKIKSILATKSKRI